MISLDLYGNPIPQARARHVSAGKFTRTYDPLSKEKELCRWQLKSQYRNEAITAPVAVFVTFFMPIPKSASGIKKRQMLHGKIRHIKKPDVDNLQKFVLDCMNKLVIEDDSQVVEITARKIYSDKPGTSIRVVALSDEENGGQGEDHRRQG